LMNRLRKLPIEKILFALILLVGIFIRVYQYGTIPPGLNQDEANIGVDAYDLLHFGVDHNGVSFPVHTISFGSGQNTAYLYMAMPFILIGGLSPFTVRLPMLLSGIMTLPLVFYVGRKTAGTTLGLISMFFIAISPWHIILSRWGLDCNILPFLFLIGYLFLLKSSSTNYWFVLAGLVFGFCVYAYGSAYVVVPIMFAGASIVLFIFKRLSIRSFLLGGLVLGIVATPMLLYIFVNAFQWDTIHIGFLTIPRLPVEARFKYMAAIFQPHAFRYMTSYIKKTLIMLWTQKDGLIYNGLDPYGYFYRYTLPLAIVGGVSLFFLRKAENKPEKLLLLIWLIAAAFVGALEVATIHRLNILFIPLIISMGLPFLWLKGKWRNLVWLPVIFLLAGFIAFAKDYFGERNSRLLKGAFYYDIFSAIASANQVADAPICVSQRNMIYIFFLFANKTPPDEFLETVHYAQTGIPWQIVDSFGRYTFDVESCQSMPRNTVYILSYDEFPPNPKIEYSLERFTSFSVYKPIP
jgi:4-amino-4-deoxy-L-arabinose transferase-like glycosyltransferase